MAIPIVFGLLLCVVFEVRGGRRTIEIQTPESVSSTNKGPASDYNINEDVSRNNDDSSFSSFQPTKDSFPFSADFSRFGSPLFSKTVRMRPSFAGNDPFNLQRFMTNSIFDSNILPSSLLQNPTARTSFPSADRNNGFHNANDQSVSPDGVEPLPSSRRQSGSYDDIVKSMFNRMKMPILSGLQQPTNQDNGDGNQRWGNMMPSMTKLKVEPFDINGVQGTRMQIQLNQCCINNKCFELKAGETCGGLGQSTNNKKIKQQPMTNDESFEKLIPGPQANDKVNIFPESEGQNMFEDYPSSDGVEYVYTNNDLVSYPEPQSGPLNHLYVAPIGVSESEADKIRNVVLERTNYHRRNHGMPELTINKDLNNYAQEWANKLVNSRYLQHRSDHVYGENLYKGKRMKNVGKSAVDTFYDEIAIFHPGDSENKIEENTKTHHLTQLLWKGSKLLGVGVSKNNANEYTVVCNYDPSGNVSPLFTQNLPKITQTQVDAGKDRVKEKNDQMAPQYTVVQSPVYYSS